MDWLPCVPVFVSHLIGIDGTTVLFRVVWQPVNSGDAIEFHFGLNVNTKPSC